MQDLKGKVIRGSLARPCAQGRPLHGAEISARDVLLATSGPLGAAIRAGALAYGVRLMCGDFFPLPRLVIESGILGIVFFGVLLWRWRKITLS